MVSLKLVSGWSQIDPTGSRHRLSYREADATKAVNKKFQGQAAQEVCTGTRSTTMGGPGNAEPCPHPSG